MNPIIILHVFLGEMVGLAALWMAVELLEPTSSRVRRAFWAGLILVVFAWLSYIIGGYYYVTGYAAVKAAIKAGPWDWAHKIFMETKEHIFLAGPYIGMGLAAFIYAFKDQLTLSSNPSQRSFILATAGIMFLGVALVLLMGVLITSGYRVALGG